MTRRLLHHRQGTCDAQLRYVAFEWINGKRTGRKVARSVFCDERASHLTMQGTAHYCRESGHEWADPVEGGVRHRLRQGRHRDLPVM